MWCGFTVVASGLGAAVRVLASGGPDLAQPALKLLLLLLSMVAARAMKLGWRDLGFRRPQTARWLKAVAGGLALGSVATLGMRLSGTAGLGRLLQGYSFLQLVAVIWILSSVSEEVLLRGWFQAATLGGDQARVSMEQLLPSAVLFGTLHVGLLFVGVDALTVALLLPPLLALGLLTAWLRARTGSLYPAIAAHVAFNVGGVLGGMVYVILYRATTGQMPSFN